MDIKGGAPRADSLELLSTAVATYQFDSLRTKALLQKLLQVLGESPGGNVFFGNYYNLSSWLERQNSERQVAAPWYVFCPLQKCH